MSGVLLLERRQDRHLRPQLERAANLAGFALRTWPPPADEAAGARPDLLMAVLDDGARRVSAEVARLADELHPDVPVVLVSQEPLVQAHLRLSGGRLNLLGPPLDPERLAERLALAAQWRPAGAPAGARRGELRQGRGWAGHVSVAGAGAGAAPRIELSGRLGLTAVLAAGGTAGPSIDRDLLPTIGAWRHQPDSDQLRRALAGHTADQTALLHLDPAASLWLVAGRTRQGLMALTSPHRLPGWWDFGALAAEGVHHLDAERADVVLAATALPADPAFTAAALAAAAAGGGPALLDHLAEHGERLAQPLAAVVMEARP